MDEDAAATPDDSVASGWMMTVAEKRERERASERIKERRKEGLAAQRTQCKSKRIYCPVRGGRREGEGVGEKRNVRAPSARRGPLQ